MLGLSWAAFTASSVDRAAWGPSSQAVGHYFGVTLTQLGVFATAYYVGNVVSTAVGGFIADWIGSRAVLGASLFLSGLAMIGFGNATSFSMGLILQFFVGLTAGAGLAAGAKAAAGWFGPKHRGLAMGIYMTATSAGLVLANATVPSLIIGSGWRPTYWLFGSVSIAVGVGCVLLVRPGVLDARPKNRQVPNILPLLRNRRFLFLALAGFGGLWGTNGLVAWANLLMTKGARVEPVTAGAIVVTLGAVAIAAKPLVGFIADAVKIPKRVLIICIFAGFSISLVGFGVASSPTAFFIIAPVLGVAAYAYSPLLMAMIPELADAELNGSAFGLMNAFWLLGSVAVPIVVGSVFQSTGSFAAAFATLAIGPALGIVPMIAIKEVRRQVISISQAADREVVA